MNDALKIPEHFQPVFDMLEARIKDQPSKISYGTLSVTPWGYTTPDDVEIGLGHGMGHFDVRTILVSKKLMGDKCCTINFLDASASSEEKSIATKAYFLAPSRPEEMASNIWTFFSSGIVPSDSAFPPYKTPTGEPASPTIAAIAHDMRLSIKSGELKIDQKK